MKIFVLMLLAMIATICEAQSVVVGVGQLVKMEGGEVAEAARVGVDAELNNYINIGIDAEMMAMQYNTSNVMPYLSARIASINRATIKAKAGFGWGHSFTNDVTDHNFHTYLMSVPITWDISKRLAVVAEPGAYCRTYSAHIGYHKEMAWWKATVGIVVKIGRK